MHRLSDSPLVAEAIGVSFWTDDDKKNLIEGTSLFGTGHAYLLAG